MSTHREFVKSPLNYTGGKFKLLPQITPLFPDDIGTFVDIFGGGGNVVANVDAQAHLYNDLDSHVAGLIGWMADTDVDDALAQVDLVISTFGLNRDNKDGYFYVRDLYNADSPDALRFPAVLYTLIAHSFNNQTRFNSKGKFNIPFGKREFNQVLRERFTEFVARVNDLNLAVTSLDYTNVDLPDDAFVYCDPPYLITEATYNKAASGGWGLAEEDRLEEWLRGLDARGIRWALSNVMDHQGRRNDNLYAFASDFVTTDLDMSYASASYHKKDRTSRTREVLVTNFEPSTIRDDTPHTLSHM